VGWDGMSSFVFKLGLGFGEYATTILYNSGLLGEKLV